MQPTQSMQPRSRLLLNIGLRMLLAALFLFFSEVWLWTNPPARAPGEWLMLVVGYLALASLAVELFIRYRVRDVFSIFGMAGIYALLNALLLNPETALAEFPRTLFTRVMGAHALAGVLALLLFLLLTHAPFARSFAPAGALALVLGVTWGTWGRYAAGLLTGTTVETLLTALMAFGIVGVFVLIFTVYMLQYASPQITASNTEAVAGQPAIRPLSAPLFALLMAALLIAFALRIAAGAFTTTTAFFVVLLAALCLGIVYFRARPKPGAYVDRIRVSPRAPIFCLLLAVLLLIGAPIGYSLPRGEGSGDPLNLITTVFSAFGYVWLPAVMLVLGGRSFVRLISADKL